PGVSIPFVSGKSFGVFMLAWPRPVRGKRSLNPLRIGEVFRRPRQKPISKLYLTSPTPLKIIALLFVLRISEAKRQNLSTLLKTQRIEVSTHRRHFWCNSPIPPDDFCKTVSQRNGARASVQGSLHCPFRAILRAWLPASNVHQDRLPQATWAVRALRYPAKKM